MRLRFTTCTAVLLLWFSGVAFGAGEAQKADTKAALTALETWLGPGANGEQWRKYLDLAGLHQQLENQNHVEVLQRVLVQLKSDAPGLDLPRFVRLRDALSAWVDAVNPPTPAQILDEVKQAAGEFHPPTAAQLATAKTRLDADLKSLDQYLNGLGTVGVGWRNYLGLSELRKELAAVQSAAKPAAPPQADGVPATDAPAGEATDSPLAALWKIEARFEADFPGLEMPQFLAAGDALEEYLELAEVTTALDGPDPKASKLAEEYTATVNDLAKHLEEYQTKPSEELAANIDRGLGWLWRRHLDRDLVSRVRRCYGRPNLYVAVHKNLIVTGVERPVEERDAPLSDNILGTQISGRTTTLGHVKVELVPSPNQAMFDALLYATVSSNTVGQNGPATIYANGTTQISGRKRVSVDAFGVHTVPATAAAVTRTRINGVSVSGLGQGVAEQRVAEGKGQAERVGAQHAETRLKARLDKEFATNLAKANKNFAEKFRNPLIRARKFPTLFDFSTAPDEIDLQVLEATHSQLAAATQPPQLAEWAKVYPVTVVLHQSAVNNGTTDFLAGVTLKDDEVRQKIIDLNDGKLPEGLVDDQDQEPWSITFARFRPISLDVRPGGLAVTVRGHRFTTGEGGATKHGAMNITAIYKIEPSDAGPQLVREGDLDINPPNFDAATSKLTISQISLKTVLKKKFGKMFPQEVKPKPLVLGGRWKEAGHLALDKFQADDGWLSIAYRWVPLATAPKTVARQD